jgi:hypothetical protein
MSYSGKFTPLGINAYTGLLKNTGFSINDVAKTYQGIWTQNSYTPGTVTATTVLNDVTNALPNFYQLAKNKKISVGLYRNLLAIGRPLNIPADNRINCPALGNSRPDTFRTSYAGYGTWDTKSVDEFGNVSESDRLGLVTKEYPPREYPLSGQHSYVYNLFGSTRPDSGFTFIAPAEEITVTEGSTVQFTISTSLVIRDQTTLWWAAILENGTSAPDFLEPYPAVGNVTLQPGETEQTFTIAIRVDDKIEQGEKFYVRLYLSQAERDNLSTGIAQSVVVTINDAE